MTTEIATSRSVSRIVTSIQALEGAGFLVRRPFPTRTLDHFDPFLLLDEMGPVDLKPGEAKGAPAHPHRGFETVTYILEGYSQHKDSQGHAGKLGPGDVQWMTAGAGIIHDEMPEAEFAAKGGRMHGFQIWVNLPRQDKMMHPRYQELPSSQIPAAQSPDGKISVKVVAGEAFGTRAAIDTRTPIMYLHFTLQPGATLVHAVPREYNAFAYVIDGAGLFGADNRPAGEAQMVMFAQDSGEISVTNPENAEAPLNILLLAGVPLNEPVVRYGPFVMNTEAEIYQAIKDYNSGRMGEINF